MTLDRAADPDEDADAELALTLLQGSEVCGIDAAPAAGGSDEASGGFGFGGVTGLSVTLQHARK